MNTQHVKSVCCGAKTYHRGHKRRQCVACGRTWTTRPRRRGRRPRRFPANMLRKVLRDGYCLSELARNTYHRTPQAVSHRFRKALKHLLSQPYHAMVPKGSLVLLTDGLWFRFQNRRWVLYLAVLKSCGRNQAVLWDPILLPGYETIGGWQQLLATIPVQVQSRICAWVVDNVRGVQWLAGQKGWILQLCHFHLICQLQNRRGHWRRAIEGTSDREAVYQMIRKALHAPEAELPGILSLLQKSLCAATLPVRLRGIGREFLRTIHYYRAYRKYPAWHLPTTTSALESLGSIVRDRLRRARHVRTPGALQLWAKALIRVRHVITCNGNHY